jgi:hypothetical protein
MVVLTRRADNDLEARPTCPVCRGNGDDTPLEIWLVQTGFRLLLDHLMTYVAICRECGLRLPLTLDQDELTTVSFPTEVCSNYEGMCRNCGYPPVEHADAS